MEGSALMGLRPAGNAYPIQDDAAVLAFFLAHHEDACENLVNAVMTHTDFWGEDLTLLPGLEEAVCNHLARILSRGAYEAMKALC